MRMTWNDKVSEKWLAIAHILEDVQECESDERYQRDYVIRLELLLLACVRQRIAMKLNAAIRLMGVST